MKKGFINFPSGYTTVTSTHLVDGHNSFFYMYNPSIAQGLPFNMFITQFSIKWRARLNKLHRYLSITKHESHFFYFLQLLHVSLYLQPRIPHPHPFKLQLSSHFRVLRVTKKQLKIIYCSARFNWLRFMDVEWEQHQSQNRENPFAIFITHVLSHKSCFYNKLSSSHTERKRFFFFFRFVCSFFTLLSSPCLLCWWVEDT